MVVEASESGLFVIATASLKFISQAVFAFKENLCGKNVRNMFKMC